MYWRVFPQGYSGADISLVCRDGKDMDFFFRGWELPVFTLLCVAAMMSMRRVMAEIRSKGLPLDEVWNKCICLLLH
jgi:hypothetical protein